MLQRPTIRSDHDALALRALAWAVDEPDRAGRLLALTGLDPADLRERAGTDEVLAAVIGWLESHEPDLIACAAALDVSPDRLVAAGRALSR